MKNYYKILGVLDDAEDIIIRAAYKALAQRYHPDKWTGDKEAATKKMFEINEAYDVLSNESSRKKYDAEFFQFNSRGDYENFEEDPFDDIENDLNHDWKIAIEFYPSIADEFSELNKISPILANTFKSFLIETQQFNNSKEIKLKYEEDYLLKFYGSNKSIQNYAKYLLLNSHKRAAIKLNKVIRVLGQSANFDSVRSKINAEFPEIVKTLKNTKLVHSSSYRRFLESPTNASTNDAILIIEMWYDIKVRVKQGFFMDQYSFDAPDYLLSYKEIDADAIKSIANKIVQDLNIFYPN